MYKNLGSLPYPTSITPSVSLLDPLDSVIEKTFLQPNLRPQSPKPVPKESPIIDLNNIKQTDPSLWGPSFWKSFHTMAKYYSSDPSPVFSEKMKKFISCIPWILPCDKCRMHAQIYIDLNLSNDTVSSNEKLFLFFFNFHNAVNKRLGKKELTLEEAIKLY